MVLKLLSTLLLIISSQFSFCQTIKGKVVFNNYAVPKVEVINANSRTLIVTDVNGDFSIVVKVNDILVFISKEHELKNILVTPEIISHKVLMVELTLKAEELKEVIIANIQNIKLTTDLKWEQAKRDEIASNRADNSLKPPMIDDASMDKGLNLKRIGSLLISLLSNKKYKITEPVSTSNFVVLAKKTCDKKFYIETLKLKADEMELFIQFCDADPKSKTIATTDNVLSTMDFLLEKSKAFKKL